MAVANKPGFTIVKSIDRPDPDLVGQFRGLAAANISDVQGRQNTMDARIKPIYQPMAPLYGPAITVKARPGDNLVPFKAIELAEPGDVIVISGALDMNYTVWGGIMSAMSKKKGIAGVVTDGLVRDVAADTGGWFSRVCHWTHSEWSNKGRSRTDQPPDFMWRCGRIPWRYLGWGQRWGRGRSRGGCEFGP